MTDTPDNKRAQGSPPVTPPPDLTPPGSTEQEGQGSSGMRTWLVVAGGALLLVGALFVLFLPMLQTAVEVPSETVPEATSPVVLTSVPETAAPETAAPAQSQGQEANRLLESWLRKKITAEAEDVGRWGGERYEQAIGLAEECERQFVDRKFAKSEASCTQAIALLDDLVSDKETLFSEALASGAAALDRGDAEVAATAFRKALEIEPDNAKASSGLKRAEKLPDVLALVAAGKTDEAAGELAAARKNYAAAAALDGAYQPAREGVSRVSSAISARQFRQAMSRALQAFANGDLDRSASALRQAAKLRPNDPAVRDLRQQISGTKRADALGRLRQSSEDHIQNERWAEALKVCEEALSVDPQVVFAVSCREQARQRVTLDQGLKALIARPEKLYEAGTLAEAKTLLKQARRVTPPGPRLTSQITQLAALIVEAEAEVEVILQSDGLTDVVIYHVGRLGRFQEKRLVLRTGNYTAAGSRSGYRDVRLALKVRSGSDSRSFRIQCEDPI